ncbi:hypothetical protein DM474_00320 [Lactobacillus helveticus]|uniref:BppU family phage baseplate upper protein n=1 Tax=Lactobacillus helveticus TaxID=1587 RepID=UPI000D7BF6AB|nr:BppU family phage baseplate upper protein [Lactobacillus helveticus]PXZ21893.1 hypothetical protein DM474_00320 [Lactobacillus helveticus]
MAKHDKLKLPIAKADRTTDFPVLKYSSTERGKTVDVTVIDTDGLPYNLNGLDLYFVEELYNGQMIVDDGKQENAGKFFTIDLENGKFSYQFPENIYQYDGWAHFKFMKGDNLIDTTAGFAIKIIDDIDSDLDEKSYVAYFENIKKEHQAWLDKAKELLASAQDLNADNYKIVSNCKKALDELTKKHNDLSEIVNSNFTSLTGRIDSLNKEKDQLNTKVDQLTQDKNNLSAEVNNLKNTVDWQIVDHINADTVTYTSKLFITNVNSVPENNGGWGYLITDKGYDNPNRVTQEWWSDKNTVNAGQVAKHYYRQKLDQNWTPWVAQTTQNDVDSLTKKISDNATALVSKADKSDVTTLASRILALEKKIEGH